MFQSKGVTVQKTKRFSVIGIDCDPVVPSSSADAIGIFLDLDEPYTRQMIEKVFSHASRSEYFQVTLGPGDGMDAVPLPSTCSFQWSEYERIDWDAVRAGKHGASSYCIRKGLSRKAQLAYHTRRHITKNPESILREAIPNTVVVDTWPVWEDDASLTAQGGLADVVVRIGSRAGDGAVNRRNRLDQCLAGALIAMEAAEKAFEANGQDTQPPVWILKGSTTNKGDGLYIVHIYEQIVDHCWSEPNIREW